ncbi:MAG: hypothetical protein ABSD48_01635 [Armatimonadota bacterium]|jgi:hypothetical protein
MVRNSALLAAIGICLACPALALAGGKQPAAKRPKQAAAIGKPSKQVDLPGPVDRNSLGFGSPQEDIERLMGKPTRVAKATGGATWFYGLSNITVAGGRVIAWCKYKRPLPMNIGAAQPGSPSPRTGSSARNLVAAQGTPDTVVVSGDCQSWFYGPKSYSLRHGKLVPTEVRAPTMNTVRQELQKTPPGKSEQPFSTPPRQRLLELLRPALARGL